MRILIALTFGLFVLGFSRTGHAQSAELFEQKSKLEKLITDKMRTAIATSLEKGAYDVSVSVTLAETSNTPPKNVDKEPVNEENKKLEDLQLGLLNADELIRTYQKEIQDLKLAKEALKPPAKDHIYEVKQVQVTVGLQEDLGDKYVNEFQSWLAGRVKAEFGKSGKALVNKIKPRPAPVTEKKVKTLLDYAKDFQFAISTLLGILGLILAVVLFKMIKSRDSIEEQRLLMQMNQLGKKEGTPEKKDERDVGPNKKSEMVMYADIKNMKDLMTKMVLLLTKSDLDLSKIVQTWLETGGDGLQKTACIFDSLLSQNGHYKNDDENIEILRSVIIPESYKKSVAETLLTMKETPNEFKIRYLESAYWDLLSFQTLGDEFLKRPFSYISAIDPKDIKEVLLSQPANVRSIALLALPGELKARVISELDPQRRRELIQESIGAPDIAKKELDSISESLKHQMLLKGKREEKFSSIELLPSLLDSLSAIEEITLLADLSKTKPEQTANLRKQWPTLAFVHQWREDALKKLISICNTDELEALIKTLPDAKNVILPLVSSRVREILEDSLRLNVAADADKIEALLKSARAKMLEALRHNELKMQNIYKESLEKSSNRMQAA